MVNLNGKLTGQQCIKCYLLISVMFWVSCFKISVFLLFVAADYTEIKNHFMASRESLPVMFIATPNDKKVSIWTKEGPSVQVSEEYTY